MRDTDTHTRIRDAIFMELKWISYGFLTFTLVYLSSIEYFMSHKVMTHYRDNMKEFLFC